MKTFFLYCCVALSLSLYNSVKGAEIIIDDPAATYTGSWATSTSSTDKYATNYHWSSTVASSSTATATYRPLISTAGNYDVYVWYPQGSNRSTNSKWLVSYNGGTTNVIINQQGNGGSWQLIAPARNCAAGTAAFAQLSNFTGATGAVVVADAVRFYAPVPTIASQPQDQSVAFGQNATFSVTISSINSVSYQWKKNGSNLSGATSTSLTIQNVQSGDMGTYTVVVTSVMGSTTSSQAVLRSGFALSLIANPGGSVSKSPDKSLYNPGDVVTITATPKATSSQQAIFAFSGWSGDASDNVNPLTITMTKSKTIQASFVSTTSEIIIDNEQAQYEGNWIIGTDSTDKFGTYYQYAGTTSDTHPTSTAYYYPNIDSAGVPAPGKYSVYIWYPQGSNRTTHGHVQVYGTYNDWADVFINQTSGGGAWRTVVTDLNFDLDTSGEATISNDTGESGKVIIADAIKFVSKAQPFINYQPESQTVPVGASVTFALGAAGAGPMSYQWMYNGGQITGQTSASIKKTNVQLSDTGSYSTSVNNSYGAVTSASAILIVAAKPTIISQPQSQTACVGGGLTLSVTAEGTPPLSYQWKHNGSVITVGTASTLTLANLSTADAGSYTVDVTGPCETTTSSAATVTVLTPVNISTSPQSASVCENATVAFSVTASGTSPTYQWQYNGYPIGGAVSSTFTIGNVAVAQAGSYNVVVNNSCNSQLSQTAVLTVNPNPRITAQPQNQFVCPGGTATFNVSATGTSPLTYQWKFNGNNIQDATGSTFSKNNVSAPDYGSYSVVVTGNSCGRIFSADARLASGQPNITAQPPSRTACYRSTVMLSVTAEGASPLTYEWKKDGVSMGATVPTLTLRTVNTSDSGSYTVTVTSPCGATETQPCVLTVQQPPSFTKLPDVSVCPGQDASLQTSLNDSDGPYTYQWYFGSGPISGATDSIYTKTSATAADAGTYTVVANNLCGTGTGVAVLNIKSVPTITTQPVSQTVYATAPVTFNVSATGVAPFSYQWQKDGSDISGANDSSFTINSTLESDAGSYSVRVTDQLCSVVSSTATLDVLVVPVAGDVLVSEDSGLIEWFTAYGTWKSKLDSGYHGYFDWQTGMALDGSGNLFVVEFGKDRVTKFEGPSFTSHTTFGNCSPCYYAPECITFDAAGNAYISNTGQNARNSDWYGILKFAPDGTLLEQHGKSIRVDWFDLAADHQTIYYTDEKGNVYRANLADPTHDMNLIEKQATFDAEGKYQIAGLSTGKFYCWDSDNVGGGAVSLINGTDTITQDGNFVAKGNTILLTGTPGAAVPGLVREVFAAIDDGAYAIRLLPDGGALVANTGDIKRLDQDGNVVKSYGDPLGWFALNLDPDGVSFWAATYTGNDIYEFDIQSGTQVQPPFSASGPNPLGIGGLVIIGESPSSSIIARQPRNQIACYGSSASFNVAVSGAGPFTYQWKLGGHDIADATQSSITIPDVENANLGIYSVTVSAPGNSVTSIGASLTTSSLEIVSPPMSRTTCAGGAVSLRARANLTCALAYQWRLNGQNIQDATAAAFSIPNASVSDSGSYDVVISATCGSVTSDIATVNVSSGPNITTQPVSQTVTVGSGATFSVSATGTGPLAYQWIFNDNPINDATDSSFSESNLTQDKTGYLAVQVSDFCGTTLSEPAARVVVGDFYNGDFENGLSGWLHTPEVYSAGPPAIEGSHMAWFSVGVFGTMGELSQTFTVTPGSVYQLSCDLTPVTASDASIDIIGGGNALQQTAYDAAMSGPGPAFNPHYHVCRQFTVPPDVNVIRLSIENVKADEMGVDSVIVEKVLPPSITTQPQSQTVMAGNRVSFSVNASGFSPFFYQWQLDGQDILNATESTYIIDNAQSDSIGSYSVIVRNAAGSITSAAALLTVNPSAPIISAQPQSRTVYQGDDVVFTVVASGTFPISYGWKLDNNIIPGANSSTLALHNVQTSDAGVYSVVIANSIGSASSENVSLTVNIPTPPQILSQPTSQTASLGDTVIFSPKIIGSTPLLCQWYHNMSAIGTGTPLKIQGIKAQDGGSYFAIISNPFGSTTSTEVTITLSDPTPPRIVIQPKSQIVTEGDTTCFSVLAAGGGLQYQWTFNGDEIDGGTDSAIIIDGVQAENAGTFAVQVKNGLGQVNSSDAFLYVRSSSPTRPNALVTSPFPDTVANGIITLNVTATDDQGLSSLSLFIDGARLQTLTVNDGLSIGENQFVVDTARFNNGFHEMVVEVVDNEGISYLGNSDNVECANVNYSDISVLNFQNAVRWLDPPVIFCDSVTLDAQSDNFPAAWSLAVHDETGALIRTIPGSTDDGAVHVFWDGADESGQVVPELFQYKLILTITPQSSKGPPAQKTITMWKELRFNSGKTILARQEYNSQFGAGAVFNAQLAVNLSQIATAITDASTIAQYQKRGVLHDQHLVLQLANDWPNLLNDLKDSSVSDFYYHGHSDGNGMGFSETTKDNGLTEWDIGIGLRNYTLFQGPYFSRLLKNPVF